jgi:hypothetical protein
VESARKPAAVLAGLAAGTSVAGLVLKLFPAFSQHNLEIVVLTLPANLGLAIGVSALARAVKA